MLTDAQIKAIPAELRLLDQWVGASNKVPVQAASGAPEAFGEKWGKKYPEVAQAWERDWAELMPFMDFGEHLRRMIYTTNAVEALHRQIRKVTKSKGSWASDKALVKQLYIIFTYGRGGWKKKVFNWGAISRELRERFGERYTQHME
jgi:transposase-like protein